MEKVMCDICRGNPAYRIQLEVNQTFGLLQDIEIQHEYVDICPRCLMGRLSKFLQVPKKQFRDKFIQIMANAMEITA